LFSITAFKTMTFHKVV